MFHSKQRPKSFQKSMVEALAFLTQLQFANFLMVVGVAGGPPQPLPIGRAQVGSAESWTAARRRCTASVWVYDADVFHHREAPRLQFDGTRQIVIDVASTDQPPIHIHMQNRVFQGSFRLPGSCSSCVFYSFRSLPGPKHPLLPATAEDPSDHLPVGVILKVLPPAAPVEEAQVQHQGW